MMRRAREFVWVVVVASAIAPGVTAQKRSGVRKEDTRPAVWQKAKGAHVLSALRAARLDGIRKLIGRIYGLQIDGTTEVLDLAAISEDFRSSLAGRIHGFKEIDTTYLEDGSCQLEMQITLRDVVEIVRTSYRRVKKDDRVVSEDRLRRIETENRERVITVQGSGALPGSQGVRVIQAQRAAEAKAQEKIAARLLGIKIDAATRVRDFVLGNDRIKSVVAASLKGVKFTEVNVTDQYVEVTGQLTIKNTIERIARYHKRYAAEGKRNVERLRLVGKREETKTITEVGRAAYRDDVEEPMRGVRASFDVEQEIIERVLRTEIKVED